MVFRDLVCEPQVLLSSFEKLFLFSVLAPRAPNQRIQVPKADVRGKLLVEVGHYILGRNATSEEVQHVRTLFIIIQDTPVSCLVQRVSFVVGDCLPRIPIRDRQKATLLSVFLVDPADDVGD